jgi:hypothetical protein
MSANSNAAGAKPGRRAGSWLLLLALLAGALAVLCHDGFKPYDVMWDNDTALGAMDASWFRMPGTYAGIWNSGNWIGVKIPACSPDLGTILATFVSPEMYLKIFAPCTMLLLGFSAWVLFRQLKFAPMVCVAGGLAAGLNMHCFSNACWGTGTWNISMAMIFLALAALVTGGIRQTWIKAALAGLAVGMAVMEGFDSGAILSVYVAVFVVFFCWIAESFANCLKACLAVLLGLGAAVLVMNIVHIGLVLRLFLSVCSGLLCTVFFCWIMKYKVLKKIIKTSWVVCLMVVCALWIAANTLSTLVGTSIKGIAGMGQTAEEKQNRWVEATMWSLPKLETLRVIMPGIFGYRLDNYDTTPDRAGVYWGKVAEDPHITALDSSDPAERVNTAAELGLPPEEVKILQENDAQAREVIVDNTVQRIGFQRRHTGSGEFAGVLVSLLALFALACAGQRGQPPYSKNERRLVWFWGLAALFSLVAAWGRYAYLYALLYKIPWFSTIRNPMKFMHPFHLAWIILAGYGLEALWRGHLRGLAPAAGGPGSAGASPNQAGASPHAGARHPQGPAPAAGARGSAGASACQAGAAPAAPESRRFTAFEKGWIGGLLLAAAAAGLLWWIYAAGNTGPSRHLLDRLSTYIQHQGFGEEWGARIASFALGEAGWFVLFLGLSAGAVACILTGVLRGRRAVWAWAALCGIMICELGRADQPWVRYYNYKEKYADNDLMKILRQEPWEHRVAAKLVPNGNGYPLCPGEYGILGAACHWWLENDFPYNDIQAVDLDQLARPPMMETNIFAVFAPRYPPAQERGSGQTDFAPPVRLWKLCNARYLIAPYVVVPFLNNNADPVQGGFQVRERFNLARKEWVTNAEDMGDLTPVITNNGPYALIEITNALPRAKLYSNWQTPADDASALQLLNSPAFDPMKTVLVSSNTPVPAAAATPDADPGSVRIVDYKPKEVHLQAVAKTAAILLLNDRTDPDWHAWVDQKPVQPLRCNYMMRGVYLTSGEHTIDFRFEPSLGSLYITLAALAFGIALGAWLIRAQLIRPPAA